MGIVPPTPPGYAAGTVVVLRGTVTWKPVSTGVTKSVFPTETVTAAVTPKGDEYRFILSPGPYVLVAYYATPAPMSWVSVSVAAGHTTRQDIPDRCL